jgi:hypothetical protein
MECPGCKAVLQIDEALAGRQGKCVHCGHKIVVPRAGEAAPLPPSSMVFLSDASPEAMVRELSERKKTGLLLLFEPAAGGSCDLTKIPDAKLKFIATQNINQARFAELAASFTRRFMTKKPPPQQPSPSSAAMPPASPPTAPMIAPLPPAEPSVVGRLSGAAPEQSEAYELKGDQLGMNLEDFKQRHARFTQDGRQDLPICSNQPGYIGKAELHSEAWHQRAKIVHARVDHPLEDSSPTIAGVKTDLMLYQFVDGQLFRISGLLPTDLFHLVSDAFLQKYGPPTNEIEQPRELTWENEVSLIKLTRGTLYPRTVSSVHLIHKQLMAAAESRMPKGAADV